MAGEFNAPLFELFAALGLDSSGLTKALRESEVDLRDFQTHMVDFSIKVKNSFGIGTDAAFAFQKAIDQTERILGSNYQAAMYLTDAINEMVSAQQKSIEATRLETESREAEYEMAQRRIAQIKEQSASEREYASLKAQINAEELKAFSEHQAIYDAQVAANQAALDAEVAARANYNSLVKQLLAEETAAYKLAMAESLPFLTKFGETAGGVAGGIGGSGGIGLRVGAGGINPYLRISEGLAGLSAVIAPLMDVIIPIALIGLGIDMWEKYAKSINDVVNSLTGAVDVSKELEDATKSMLTAIEKQAEHLTKIDSMARREGKSPHEIEKEIAAVDTRATRLLQAQITDLTRQSGALTNVMTILPNLPPGLRDIGVQTMAKTQGITGAQDLNSINIKERRDKLDEDIVKLTDRKVQIQTEEVRSMERHVAAMHKWHDVVHEFPNKLPWFLGGGLFDPQPGFVGAAPSSTSTIAGSLGSRMPPPPMSRSISNGNATPAAFPSQTVSQGSGGPSITITNTYAPVFKFDGVPADISNFMRNIAEPMLIEDMKKNSRGVTDGILEALKKKGVRVG